MVLPRTLAKMNRHVTNPILGRLAGKVPPMSMVVHKGRKSGRAYRTPVWAFENDGVYRIALTYGRDVDWVKNITAAGGFELEARGAVVLLIDPVVVHDASAAWAPLGVRQALKVMSATDYLQAHPA
ncbi:nitroreductase family deazaflavin-dependent oxidoreductase [Nocardia pseudovaccinii]|uniref:nitroreductase family deazaflavin-dependent oxidoreductase n=1 Tax=Nocardia pseudovaccinii TaxID=189540 RepID=UPI0007A385E6|nr:nitroreductase family deazaflavin-dependent oxidoreductase [Nocardia pseudovaccinii]